MKTIVTLLVLINITSYAQIESDILIKANEAIKKLKSIKYNVTEQKGQETITADVTMTRDRPYLLFGVAKVKVIGISMGDHDNEQIQFASNGSTFQYYDSRQNKVVQVVEATDRKLFRTPISKFLLIPFAVYQNEEPFENIIKQLKLVKIVQDTAVFGDAAVKVRVEFETKNVDDTPLRLSSFWYFRKSDHLVVGQVTHISKKFFKIKQLNMEYADTEFTLIDGSQIQSTTGNEPNSEGLLRVGSVAPDFTLSSPTIGEFSLEKNKGKIILLDFWGTWCVPCIKAMPEIQKIHDHFLGKEVVVIGVSVEPEESVRPDQFMKRKGFTYPILLGGTSITKPYQVMIFPTVYILNKDGIVIHSEHGAGREGFTEEIIDIISRAIIN
jgi:peroxiredoxin